MPAYRPVLDRFVEKFELDTTTGCWNWTAHVSRKGYGKFGPGQRKSMDAHRVSFEIFHGLIPTGYEVHHLCRNRRCVNPNHFQLLQHKSNCDWKNRAMDAPDNNGKPYHLKLKPYPVHTDQQIIAYWSERERKRLAKNAKIPGKPFRPLMDRFVESFTLNLVTGCWEWNRPIDKGGYGQIVERTGAWMRRKMLAHRASYELFIGDIPAGLTIHHKCINPKCVNPNHLTLLTRGANSSEAWERKNQTHCKHGHAFNASNTAPRKLPSGKIGRTCIACRRAHGLKDYRARMARLLQGNLATT